MAKLIHKDKEIEVADNGDIKEQAKKLGVSFNCENGTCGTCTIEILEGKENLSELNQREKNLGMNEDFRLACQCKIKQGKVEVDF